MTVPIEQFRRGKGNEGLLTRYLFSPMAAHVAYRAQRIQPSTITLASGVVGVATSALVLFIHLGALAFLIALVGWWIAYLDCADGQLARGTQQATQGGAKFDVFADTLVHSSIGFCLAWILLSSGGEFAIAIVFALTRSLGGSLFKLTDVTGASGTATPRRNSSLKRAAVLFKRQVFDFPAQCILLATALLSQQLLSLCLGFIAILSVVEFLSFGLRNIRLSRRELSAARAEWYQETVSAVLCVETIAGGATQQLFECSQPHLWAEVLLGEKLPGDA